MIFHQFGREQLAGIVEIQAKLLAKRLAARGMHLQISDGAKTGLADEGYDPQFGARPLKRVFQQRLENPIATRILAGEFNEGDTILVDHQGKSFVFVARPAPTETVEVVEAVVT